MSKRNISVIKIFDLVNCKSEGVNLKNEGVKLEIEGVKGKLNHELEIVYDKSLSENSSNRAV